MKKPFFAPITIVAGWFILVSTGTPLKAQETATIVKFNLQSSISTDVDTWFDGVSDAFTYEDEKKKKITIRTVDTLFSYAQQVIAQKLGVQLNKKTVDRESKQNMVGKITGFPNEKVKDVAAMGKYNKLVEVFVDLLQGPTTTKEGLIVTKRKYQVDMIVEIKVYDREGNGIGKYKKRTRTDEIKETKEVWGVRDSKDLSGNEVFALFVNALNSALENPK